MNSASTSSREHGVHGAAGLGSQFVDSAERSSGHIDAKEKVEAAMGAAAFSSPMRASSRSYRAKEKEAVHIHQEKDMADAETHVTSRAMS